MGGFIRMIIVVGFLWAIGGGPFKLFGMAKAETNSASAENSLLQDPVQLGDEYWRLPGVVVKRAGFWSPHPSDYNPMRRPNPVLRPSSKRDFDNLHDNFMPYHPLARGVSSLQQRVLQSPDDYLTDGLLEGQGGERQKKHIWPSNLMYRLGQAGSANSAPSRKGQKYIPSEPTNQ